MSQLSQTLSTLRKKNNLTQEEFGAKLGVSAQSVSKWENSISMPDICLLPMIAETLGMKVFLLPADIINKYNKDISGYPQGDLDDLLAYIDAL